MDSFFAPTPNTPRNQFAPPSGDEPKTGVELHIACRKLKNMDMMSKSDPLCVVYISSESGGWVEIGRTEMVADNLNPEFVTPIAIEYKFEKVQLLRFVVVDIDGPITQDLGGHDFLGELKVELAKLVTAPGGDFTAHLTIQDHNTKSTIIIRTNEVVHSKRELTLNFSAEHVDKKDWFGKSDPYLVFSRRREDLVWIPVYKTEVIKGTLNPNWKPFVVSEIRLANGDPLTPIRIECFDWNRNSDPDYIGACETAIQEMVDTPGPKSWPLINKKKAAKHSKYTNSGTLHLTSFSVEVKHSFLDFVKGGTEMNLMVAVDLTASNGPPHDPRSLHHCPPGGMSDYEKAIRAVGSIVAHYDSDQIFPIAGFGAKYIDPRTNAEVVSHCLNLSPSPEGVQGVEGLVGAYRDSLQRVTLWGPTIFSQIIKWGAENAQQSVSQSRQHYTILLILTDGVITDFENTVDEIITASALPLSIIIVGIGEADFSAMDALDSDESLLSQNGRTAQSDIVQFVPFKKFENLPYEALAQETLEEIPQQLTSFMKRAGIEPNPPRAAPPPMNLASDTGSFVI